LHECSNLNSLPALPEEIRASVDVNDVFTASDLTSTLTWSASGMPPVAAWRAVGFVAYTV